MSHRLSTTNEPCRSTSRVKPGATTTVVVGSATIAGPASRAPAPSASPSKTSVSAKATSSATQARRRPRRAAKASPRGISGGGDAGVRPSATARTSTSSSGASGRAEDRGVAGHQQARETQLARDAGGVDGTGAAAHHEQELPRVVAALHAHVPDARRHVGVDHLHHAGGGRLHAAAERRGQRGDGGARGGFVEGKAAAEEARG